MNSIFITKTNFIHFKRCHKMGWLDKFKKNLKKKPTVAEQLNIEEGYRVGDLATKHNHFKGGIEVKTLNRKEALLETVKLLREKTSFIYEAAFLAKYTNETIKTPLQLYLRADILKYNPDKNSYDLIEVKSSTREQRSHFWDIAFQKFVLEQSGIKIEKMFLMKPDSNYSRKEDLVIEDFFKIEDVTEKIEKDFLPKVEGCLEKIYKTLNNKREPSKYLGRHCKNPWHCPFAHHCFKNINNDSVEKLSRLSRIKRKVFRKLGIKYLSEINTRLNDIMDVYKLWSKSKKFLSPKQEIQLKVALDEQPYINLEKIKFFLEGLQYPLYHLDFESYNRAIPDFVNMKPHQFVTFQASLHKEYKSGKLEHFEYLQDDKQDPRKPMIKFLLDNIGRKGSIIVYNKSFEKARIKELAKDYPEYEKSLMSLIDRMVDLEVPFNKYYYHHEFEGSSSIKKVLPVLVPELSYDRLNIQCGSDAQAIYRNLINKEYHTEGGNKGKLFRKVRRDLLDYCKLDTYAMVVLLRKLKSIIKEDTKVVSKELV